MSTYLHELPVELWLIITDYIKDKYLYKLPIDLFSCREEYFLYQRDSGTHK